MKEENNTSIGLGDISHKELLFFIYGNEYYVSGRFAVRAGFSQVYGTLFHHAVEMFLKGALFRITKIQNTYRGQEGHNLEKLWAELKLQADDPELVSFDGCIKELHKFERIRFPDNDVPTGIAVGTRWRKEDLNAGKSELFGIPMTRFEVSVDEIDEMVLAIYAAAKVTPYMIEMQLSSGIATEHYLYRNNALPMDRITANDPRCP